MRLIHILLIGVAVAGRPSTLETGPPPEDGLTVREVAGHLRFIASDELEGRRTGTAGNAVAARYVAELFRSWGLRPAGSPDGFLQPVPLDLRTPPENATIRAGQLALQIGEDFVLLSGDARMEVAGVRAGHGLVDRSGGVDDYAGLEVKGKMVVVRFGAPPEMSGLEGDGRSWAIRKRQLALEHGAAGILEILPRHLWRRFSGVLAAPRIVPRQPDPDEEQIFHAFVRLRPGAVPDWSALQVDVPALQVESLSTSNVVGMIEGRDPELRSEYLVLTAHYDHIGRDDQARAEGSGDTIFNGARDNGMGVVALLAAARSLAAQPPRRSVLVLAVTGEEQGLLGSSYYVEHPVVPLRRNAFVLNTDAAGFSDTGVVTIFGLRRISDGSVLEKACAQYGLHTVADPLENRDLFYRSDNVSFARRGVPALTFSPGFRTLDAETMKHYHRVSDEADDDFDYAYLLRFSQAYAATARALADAQVLPIWARGDEFEDTWRELTRTPVP